MLLCMGLWLLLVGAVAWLVFRGPDPAAELYVTNAKRYARERDRWGNASLTRHFPARIPAGATDVRFSVMHPVQQPRGWIRISYTVTEPEAQAERQKHCAHAARVLRTPAEVDRLRRETAEHLADGDEAPSASLPRMRRDQGAAGAGFCVCVLVDASYGRFGHSAGLTVEPETGRVEYWAFVW